MFHKCPAARPGPDRIGNGRAPVFAGAVAAKGRKPKSHQVNDAPAPKYLLYPLGGMGFSATFANSFKKGICQAGGNLK